MKLNTREQVRDAAIPMLMLALLGIAFTASALRVEHSADAGLMAANSLPPVDLAVLSDSDSAASDLQIMLRQSERAFRAVGTISDALNYYSEVRNTVHKQPGR